MEYDDYWCYFRRPHADDYINQQLQQSKKTLSTEELEKIKRQMMFRIKRAFICKDYKSNINDPKYDLAIVELEDVPKLELKNGKRLEDLPKQNKYCFGVGQFEKVCRRSN